MSVSILGITANNQTTDTLDISGNANIGEVT